ncbi:MAG TPA: hypothetical protein VFT98_22045, partial [Myxococcota bacterium]|nr:hypothetical protein [Myxococcota bacterium]
PRERAREPKPSSDELDAARRETEDPDYAPRAPAAPPVEPAIAPVRTRPDLRAFARAAARDLRPALHSGATSSDPSAARLARRVARFERFPELEPSADKTADLATVLASLLEERRDELLAKRLLVLRELEAADASVRCDEPTLRFALGAVLDTLLDAAPSRSDLYVSARPVAAGARSRLRVELRLRDARIPESALDLLLAGELLAQLGTSLELDASAPEARVTLELAR